MLSDEDKKAYLAILAKRRKVRRFLARAATELSAEMAIADEHREAAKKSMAETIELIKTDHTVSLSDYKALLDIHNDIIEKISQSVTHQNEIHGFIDGIKKKVKLFDHISNEMKLQLRRHFKGRGKVLPFERQRS